ncbi:MAG: PilZ domain-containing protein [Thermodesulfobacteriota bacterium]
MESGNILHPSPRLTFQIGTIMMVTFEQAPKPIKAVYVGLEPGAYLILRCPPGSNVHDHLFEGNELVIKYVAKGKVYGFRSSVIGYMYKKGIILVVVAYPQDLETYQLRKEQRVEVLVPARLEAASRQLSGFVVDLSPGGCRFAYKPSLDVSDLNLNMLQKIALTFQVLGREGALNFNCQVMNVGHEGSKTTLGLKFDQVDESFTDGIKSYVHQVADFLGEEA